MNKRSSFLEFIGLVALIVIVVLGVNFYNAQKQQGGQGQFTITTEDTADPVIYDLTQPGPATAVWSNPVATRSTSLNSGESKLPDGTAEDSVHHEGIELLKERENSNETRNR